VKTREPLKQPAKPVSGHDTEAAFHVIWSGTISFSLVAIPVEAVKAVEPGRISFHLLHKQDYSRLERKMFCPEEEKLVPSDEIVRGYEIMPGKYILMSDEELESLSPERSRTIEITDFIDLQEIDLIYFDHPYYLVPRKGGEKAYRLLAEVMHRADKAGIAKFVLVDREYPVVVKSTGEALVLITLHYSGDILPFDGIAPETGKTAEEEKSRMKKIIKKMTADFDAKKYADSRRKKILALLDKKVKAKAAVEAPATREEVEEGPADLITTLKESMRKVKKER
jgi:DNA end-binding protein Ku